MSASPTSTPTSVLGLALTFDPASPALVDTLARLRTRPGLTLETPQMPFVAAALESADPRTDHAWLEALPGVVAVDVAFVEVLPEAPFDPNRPARRRRRTRDPLDDSPLPAECNRGAPHTSADAVA